jgi:hypothetical protein
MNRRPISLNSSGSTAVALAAMLAGIDWRAIGRAIGPICTVGVTELRPI